MSVTEIKERLRNVIDNIHNQEFLEAMLTMANSQSDIEMYLLTPEQFNILKEREDKFLSGEAKMIPWEQVQARIKEKYGF